MDAPMMRSLPQSIEAEQSVIGAMLIDKNAMAKGFEKTFIEMDIRSYIMPLKKCTQKIWLLI